MSNIELLKEVVFDAEQFTKEKDYWLNKLSGNPGKTIFPYDYDDDDKIDQNERREGEGPGTGTVKFRFSEPLYSKLIKTINESDSRLYIILTAGLVLLLNKYTGNKDITVGIPIEKQESEGVYINTVLALRNPVDQHMKFKELIYQVRETIIEANKHLNYPIERLPYELDIPVSGNGFPLFDIAILLENIHDREYLRHLDLNMIFSFKRTDNDIEGEVRYNAFLYKKETIEAIISHYKYLIEEAFINVDALCAAIEILSKEEKKQLIVDFNDTRSDYPRDKTISQLFEHQVVKTPDNIAVAQENQLLTYKEFNERANQLAHQMRTKGVKPGAISIVMGKRTIRIITAIMGILKAGAIYLPINASDPDGRIQYIIKDSQALIMLTQTHLVEKKGEALKNLPTANIIPIDDETIYSGKVCNLPADSKAQDIAYIIYTSGTTGKPKGVIIEHRELVNYICWAAKTYVKNERVNFPLYTSISFDMTITSIFTPLLTGNSIILYGGWDNEILIEKIIDDNNVGVLKLTPSHLKLIREKKINNNHTSIKRLIVGGEQLESNIAREISKNFNGNIEIYNEYGPTETVVGCMIYKFNPGKDNRKAVPIGIPADNTQIYILSGNQILLPPGTEGEIYISGDNAARGYLNQPELSKEKFLSNPFTKGKKMYRSGDLGRMAHDLTNIEFLTRIDQQVKIRGYRIEIGEIENQLSKHKNIQDAVTLLKVDEAGDKYLCSYFVSDRELPVSELRDYLSKKLPDYMIPSFFVKLERIPLNSNGKLDRNALPEPRVITVEEYIAPRDEVEKKLLKIWQEILSWGQKDIGIDANFFELGGHSLNATILVSKIQREFNIKIVLMDIFRKPTIRKLSRYIKDAAGELFISIEPVGKKDYYELSSAQKRLYILQLMERHQVSYNIPIAFELHGKVDMGKSKQTFARLIKRHDSFRTSFRVVDGVPVQKIHEYDEIEFNIEYHESNRENVENLVKNFIRPFDLTQAPLFRIELVKLENQRHVHILMLDMHHIISDGMSMNIIIKEFVRLYQGEEIPPLRIQYKDFSQWQNKQKEKEVIKKQESFWLKEFETEITSLQLPGDYPRPALQSFEGSKLSFEINSEETQALKELALSEDATLYMVLLSIFNILLARITQQEDILVGTQAAGRRHMELEHIIGMFVNTLVVRNHPLGEKTYKVFLGEMKAKTLEVLENQDYPFEDLVEKVVSNRDMSRNPLFDVEFRLDMEMSDLVIPGLKLKPYIFENRTSKFDLSLYGVETENKLVFNFEYCTKLFKKETIQRFIIYFKQIISSVLEDPGKSIGEIEVITGEERKQLLFDFNNTTAEYPRDKTIHEIFTEQAERSPDSLAVMDTAQSAWHTRLTYRELNEKSNQLARHLRDKGVEPDTIVAIMMERSSEMIIGLLGIFKSGGAYLPIDPGYPEARKRFMLENSETKVLITQGYLLDNNRDIFNRAAPVNIISIDDRNIYMGDGATLTNKNKPMDLAYLIYTSGTTGKPKGVMIEHRGVVNYICWAIKQYVKHAGMNFPLYTSISFDLTVTSIFTPLLSGNAVVVYKGDNKEFLIEKIIEEDQVGIIKLTPSHLKMIRDKMVGRVSNIKSFIVGGEDLETTLARDISRKFNGDIEIYNEYGPTEATVGCMIYKFDGENDNGKSVPIGIPAANTRIYILDKNQEPVPIGVPGELYIGGDGVARGYWKSEDLTAGKFTADPFISGGRLYCSGDLARMLPGGNIEFLGRIDNQVKVRGFRIEPGEIENRLLDHPQIKNAAVTARADEKGDKNLYAYIVTERNTDNDTGNDLNASQLRDYLMKDLPAYMIPSHFVRLPELPLTAHGKLDRTALDSCGTNDANGTALGTGAEYVAPANKLEKIVARAWKDVLRVDNLGIRDNFFDLGGTSMDIILIINTLKETLGLDVPITTMFEYPTIESFSRHMNRQEKEEDLSGLELDLAKDRMEKTFKSIKERAE